MSLTETLSEITHLNEESRECLENCLNTFTTCEWCADECGLPDFDHCQKCAEVLRDCAESCRRMSRA